MLHYWAKSLIPKIYFQRMLHSKAMGFGVQLPEYGLGGYIYTHKGLSALLMCVYALQCGTCFGRALQCTLLPPGVLAPLGPDGNAQRASESLLGHSAEGIKGHQNSTP